MSRQKKEEKITKPNSINSYFYKAMGYQTCFISAYNLNSQGVATNLLYPINTQNMTNGSKTFTFTYTGTGRQYLSFAFYISNHTNPLATRFFTIDNFTVKFTGNYPFTETVAVYDGKDYRYGFNGKEMDNDLKGKGVQYDYGFRIYDSRVGKFLSIDPLFKSFPWYTPYQFAGNKPVIAIDLDGLEELIIIRWFDGNHYRGESFLRVNNSSEREANKRNGWDGQIIELDVSVKDQFLSLQDHNRTSRLESMIKNQDGSFKGEYVPVLENRYQAISDAIREYPLNNSGKESYIKLFRNPTVVNFKYSKDVLRSDDLSSINLAGIKNSLEKNSSFVLTIEGFSSNEPIPEGSDFDNMQLSIRRANMVRDYLVNNGVDPNRIKSVEGRGDTDVFTVNGDITPNRRAQISIGYEKTQD